MSDDQARLSGYVEAWKGALDEVVALLSDLTVEQWRLPTDLPEWTVHDVAAHLAHIESVLCGARQPAGEPDPEGAGRTQSRNPTGAWTGVGVAARRAHTGRQIVEELVHASDARLAVLRGDPPTDGSASPPITPGGLPWDWETLLSNRVVDMWMHLQDIRRAVGRPGGLDTPAAAHTAAVFARAFPYCVGKRVAPPSGTTVELAVSGRAPVHLAVEVDERGRAVPMTDRPASPTVRLGMDLEAFAILGGGRRPPGAVDVVVSGDAVLGREVLAAMAVTP
jgi:uncharacterized protein (TIGR03083 family)